MIKIVSGAAVISRAGVVLRVGVQDSVIRVARRSLRGDCLRASDTGQAAAWPLAKRLIVAGIPVEVRLPERIGMDWADEVMGAAPRAFAQPSHNHTERKHHD